MVVQGLFVWLQSITEILLIQGIVILGIYFCGHKNNLGLPLKLIWYMEECVIAEDSMELDWRKADACLFCLVAFYF